MKFITSNSVVRDCVLYIKKETEALCNDSSTLHSHGTPICHCHLLVATDRTPETSIFLLFAELKYDVLDSKN